MAVDHWLLLVLLSQVSPTAYGVSDKAADSVMNKDSRRCLEPGQLRDEDKSRKHDCISF